MNLQTKLDERLWDAIRSTYESHNFSATILDAIHFLSELIRERSGLDGDGANLIGRAFGGKIPILKVNSLNTESERNVQAGIEQLLRGIYQAVRNPRSHGTNQDTEDDAVAIILFINHMLKTIDLAKAPFSQQVFVKRIHDKLGNTSHEGIYFRAYEGRKIPLGVFGSIREIPKAFQVKPFAIWMP